MTKLENGQLPNKISIRTNECYIMNMWWQNNLFDYMVDGKLRKTVKGWWEEDWSNYGKGVKSRPYHIKVTFERVYDKK